MVDVGGVEVDCGGPDNEDDDVGGADDGGIWKGCELFPLPGYWDVGTE